MVKQTNLTPINCSHLQNVAFHVLGEVLRYSCWSNPTFASLGSISVRQPYFVYKSQHVLGNYSAKDSPDCFETTFVKIAQKS